MKLVFTMLLFAFSPLLEDFLDHPIQATQLVTISGIVVEEGSNDPIPSANILVEGHRIATATDVDGKFELKVPEGELTLIITFIGYETKKHQISVGKEPITNLVIQLAPSLNNLEEIVVSGMEVKSERAITQSVTGVSGLVSASPMYIERNKAYMDYDGSSEEYEGISENQFKWAQKTPLSTFSIDVDGASYSNVRRMITDGYLPHVDAIRVEELINYFNYHYAEPTGNDPFAVHTEIAPAPWNPNHQIVQIGLQGQHIEADNLPPSNLVFLLDVSGSMSSFDKLPLLKNGFKLLVNELREEDFVSIVVYAGSSGLVLPPTSGHDKETILNALEKLQSGGSTAGAAGIEQAYKVAMKNFRADANNRVILATDGDFNVGMNSDEAMVSLIEEKREHGIFLSVLGFGTGNLKDSKMEKIANHGNGNYYYIDNLLEAKKVLVSEMGGTLHTIAKDVKIQVEFNPQNVQAYRLIGYENRLLADEDFNDDKKDAGELGAGHTVSALYEVIPTGVVVDHELTDIDPLKYQIPSNPVGNYSNEIMTVKLRYKKPDGDTSKLLSTVITANQINDELSENLSFASSIATFGMILRDSKFKGDSTFDLVYSLAKQGKGDDANGYRSEFLRIAELADLLWQGQSKK